MMSLISNTPYWAWIILAYLIFIGVKSTKKQIVYLPKLFIIPTILIGLKYKTLISHNLTELYMYFSALSAGVIIGILYTSTIKIVILKPKKSIEIPGTYFTLLILLGFFAVKYYFGYLKAAAPELFLQYSFIETIISASFSGYFLGRAMFYVYRFEK